MFIFIYRFRFLLSPYFVARCSSCHHLLARPYLSDNAPVGDGWRRRIVRGHVEPIIGRQKSRTVRDVFVSVGFIEAEMMKSNPGATISPVTCRFFQTCFSPVSLFHNTSVLPRLVIISSERLLESITSLQGSRGTLVDDVFVVSCSRR